MLNISSRYNITILDLGLIKLSNSQENHSTFIFPDYDETQQLLFIVRYMFCSLKSSIILKWQVQYGGNILVIIICQWYSEVTLSTCLPVRENVHAATLSSSSSFVSSECVTLFIEGSFFGQESTSNMWVFFSFFILSTDLKYQYYLYSYIF